MTFETLFLMLLRTSLISCHRNDFDRRFTACDTVSFGHDTPAGVVFRHFTQGVLWIQYPLAVPSVTVSTKTMQGHITSGALAYIDKEHGEVAILPLETSGKYVVPQDQNTENQSHDSDGTLTSGKIDRWDTGTAGKTRNAGAISKTW